MATLQEILETLRDRMRHSKNIIGSQTGPLTGSDKTNVTNDLSGAQTDIADALALISNAGTERHNLAATLPGIASDCDSLAQSAFEEGQEPSPNATKIGSWIKSINWQIDADDGYREQAGIP